MSQFWSLANLATDFDSINGMVSQCIRSREYNDLPVCHRPLAYDLPSHTISPELPTPFAFSSKDPLPKTSSFVLTNLFLNSSRTFCSRASSLRETKPERKFSVRRIMLIPKLSGTQICVVSIERFDWSIAEGGFEEGGSDGDRAGWLPIKTSVRILSPIITSRGRDLEVPMEKDSETPFSFPWPSESGDSGFESKSESNHFLISFTHFVEGFIELCLRTLMWRFRSRDSTWTWFHWHLF